MHGARDEKDRNIIDGIFLVSRCDSPPLLESVEASLDDIATAVALAIDDDQPLSVGSRRNDRDDSTPSQRRPRLVAIVSLVAGEIVGTKARSPAILRLILPSSMRVINSGVSCSWPPASVKTNGWPLPDRAAVLRLDAFHVLFQRGAVHGLGELRPFCSRLRHSVRDKGRRDVPATESK